MSLYRVNLAPLRYGAGLKGKVFDGFQTGTPTVMTPIAAEGICMNLRLGSHLQLKTSPMQLYNSTESLKLGALVSAKNAHFARTVLIQLTGCRD